MAGNVVHTRELAASAEQASSDLSMAPTLALAYAYAGNFDRADALLDRLLQTYPESTLLKQLYAQNVRALEAMQHHDAASALTALEGARAYDFAFPLSLPYVRGLTYLASGQPQTAASEFQRILDHPGIDSASPVHSLARLQLARAYLQAGDTGKARTAYQDFFALWKDADSDVPILKQAQAEYAKLK